MHGALKRTLTSGVETWVCSPHMKSSAGVGAGVLWGIPGPQCGAGLLIGSQKTFMCCRVFSWFQGGETRSDKAKPSERC